ncbi:hypothetical protein RCO48_21270 [Peribacillus frigoritolerans]|nr:hypothetical protein [Peribacillus frigoritolerans]
MLWLIYYRRCLKKVGIIVIAAFLLSYMKPFRQMIGHEHEMSKKIMFIFLEHFGIISNYTGIENRKPCHAGG